MFERIPVRQLSAKGQPAPFGDFTRRCQTCGACFIGLAVGKTGERGLWHEWQWFCSVQCYPAALPATPTTDERPET